MQVLFSQLLLCSPSYVMNGSDIGMTGLAVLSEVGEVAAVSRVMGHLFPTSLEV